MVVPGVGNGDEKLPISVSGGHNDSRFVVAHQKNNKATPFRKPNVSKLPCGRSEKRGEDEEEERGDKLEEERGGKEPSRRNLLPNPFP